jgi:hypothetical protein
LHSAGMSRVNSSARSAAMYDCMLIESPPPFPD